MLSALQAERTRFRAMFEQAAVGMAQVSLDGRWVAVNQRLADIVGRTREQMLGMSFQEITHRDDLGRDLDLARRVVAGELPAYEMEKRYLRKDGSSVWVNLTAALVRRDDGSPDYFISVVQDISARVAAEAELRRLNAELEERVEQRTEALSAVNAELETFSYSVSHDLRAPLRSIDGFSQALVEDVGDKLDAEARDHLRRIRRATARMAELIDDLLQLSRLSRVDLRRDRVDASGLARTILDELRQREPGRKVDVQVQPGLVVAADPKLVRILFENLLGNAWKFTRRSAHPRIEVLSSDGELGVRDNGAGFDMAYADQLFKPFHRLHRSDQFEGSGIGLATVRRIVHRHGGHIRAESEPGRGATFWFTLLPEPRGAVARTVVAHRDSRTSA
jgi:PAS domain S-box-containing protein